MEPFDIKTDDKFFSRLVAKESSGANPSFRVYYGDVCGAVPFTWESRPGTPRHTLFTPPQLPPLSPPPSYNFHPSRNICTRNVTPNLLRKPRSNLLRHVFTRNKSNKVFLTTSPSSSNSSLSSLSWSPSFSSSSFNGRRLFSSWGSSLHDGGVGDEHQSQSARVGSKKPLKSSRFICFPFRRKIEMRYEEQWD